MQERAKGAQHIYQRQNSTEKHLETQNEPNEPKKLGAILADNGTDLAEIDSDQEQDSSSLF